MHGQVPRRWIVIVLVTAYIVSLLINLGIVPLYLEETRRSFITLEMLIRGDWLVPTELGELYCRKPPLFNWVMIPFYKVFGLTEWAPRMITVLSLLGMALLNWWFVRRYATQELAFWSTALFLVGGDIYFSFSTIGEIDIFYSLVTYASIVTVFHFDRQQRPWALFLATYGLSAIGFLTKGLPSIVFPVVTLVAWFGWQRRWRTLFSVQHVAGILLFVALAVAFFFAYSRRAPLDGYLQDLWSQSSERTVVGTGAGPVFGHFFTFTLETLLNILPASLLLPFLFRKGSVGEIRRDPFLLFCALALIANAIVYWFSPGSRSRYIYMLFPLMAILLTHGWLSLREQHDIRHRYLHWIITISLLLLGALALVAPWLPDGVELGSGLWIVLVIGIGLMALGWMQVRHEDRGIATLVGAVILVRIGFDLVVLPLRATTGDIPMEKDAAMRITEIANNEPLHLYDIQGEGGISFTTVFYLERDRWRLLDKVAPGHENASDLYIAQQTSLADRRYDPLYTWMWKDRSFILLRFNDRQPSSPSP
jgi:4-amino-4-deoxy-L-arabinose transferase-like glycosyltransferase